MTDHSFTFHSLPLLYLSYSKCLSSIIPISNPALQNTASAANLLTSIYNPHASMQACVHPSRPPAYFLRCDQILQNGSQAPSGRRTCGPTTTFTTGFLNLGQERRGMCWACGVYLPHIYIYVQGRMERGKEVMLLLRGEAPEAWFRYLQPGDVFCLVFG